MMKCVKHMPNPPKISVALKYGTETIKMELNQEGLDKVVAAPEDIFSSNNSFMDVLRSLQIEYCSSTTDAKIGILMKSNPTMTWEHKTLSNLRLTVDDLPNMYALKEDVSSCLAKGINACFPIMPMSDYMNDEDVYHRARALVYHCCKDLGHTLNKNHMRQGLHYVCDDAQVKDLVKAFESQEGGISNQKAVIWIHVRSPLDLSPLIKSDVSNKMNVVYLVTGGSEDSSDSVERVISCIKKEYELKEIDIKDRRRNHQLGPAVSGIEVSDNGVAFSLSLEGVDYSKFSKKKIQMTLAKEVANAKTNDEALNVFKHQELTCYDDGDGSLHVHVNVRDVKQLVRAFSVVHFDRHRLGLSDMKLNYKMENALSTFLRCMLKLETMTRKQKELFKKWIRLRKKYK